MAIHLVPVVEATASLGLGISLILNFPLFRYTLADSLVRCPQWVYGLDASSCGRLLGGV